MNVAIATKTEPTVEVKTAKPVKIVTTEQLMEVLGNLRGATPITFTHCTTMSKSGKMVQKDRKDKSVKNPYWGDCFKSQVANGMVNFHYDKAVLRKLAKKGLNADVFKQGKSWHMPIIRKDGTLTPFRYNKKDENKTPNYFAFKLERSTNVKYQTANGTPIDTDSVKPFLCERSDYANQGLAENDVIIFQVWGINDVTAATINGQRYRIVR
jgi:hypothetical protein